MRRSILLVTLAAAAARGDASIPAPPPPAPATPHTPIGSRCDAALAEAQLKFLGTMSDDVKFHVRERRVTGTYSWSDMCGVWGNYTVELAPDLRPARGWQSRTTPVRAEDEEQPARRVLTRRARGYRATIRVEGDKIDFSARYFIDSFLPALDACLRAAPGSPKSGG